MATKNKMEFVTLNDLRNLPPPKNTFEWCYPREKWVVNGFGRGSIGVIYSNKEYGLRGKGYVADCYCDHKVENGRFVDLSVVRFETFDEAYSHIYYNTKEHLERKAA